MDRVKATFRNTLSKHRLELSREFTEKPSLSSATER